MIVFRGGVLPQLRDLYPVDNLVGVRGDVAGSLALILSRPGGAGLEFLHILAVRRHCNLEYFGQVGAGAILGFFLRSSVAPAYQILRTLVIGAITGDPIGLGGLPAGAAGQELEHECKNGKGREFHFHLLVVGLSDTQCWVRYVLCLLLMTTPGYSSVAMTCSPAPSKSTVTV